MADGSTSTPRIARLADRLAEDIAERQLKSGDRYLTAAEASKMLGVGNGAANKALQLLERRRLIVRQQRRGAFITDPPHRTAGPSLNRVHFLVHQKYLRAEGVGQDDVLIGIEHEMPGVPVQISFLPTANEATFVAELIDESARAKRTDGFILVRTSYETQRLLADRQVPAVVYGTLYPSIDRLASLSHDMTAVGRLLTDYLLERGHATFAYLNRQLAYGGDQRTMEGIQASLHAAGKGLDALTLRFLPSFTEVYVAEAEKLFSRARPPTAFVCRTVRMADAVAEVAERRGCLLGRDVDVGVCDYYFKPGECLRYVRARPDIDSERQGRRLAQLLLNQLKSDGERIEHDVMPVTLQTTEDSHQRNGW